MRYDKGFSLMELIATIAIVAIVATVGVPSFLDGVQNNRIRTAGEELYQRLYEGRSKAINEQSNVFISFNTGTNWCFGLNSSGYCDCTNPNSCDIGTVTNKNDGVSLSVVNYASNQTQITSGRGTFSDAGAVIFSLNGKNVTVQTALMGRIRICSSTVGGFKPC